MAKALLKIGEKELEIDGDHISVRDGIKMERMAEKTWDELSLGLMNGSLESSAIVVTVLAQKVDKTVKLDDVLDLDVFDLLKSLRTKIAETKGPVTESHPTQEA